MSFWRHARSIGPMWVLASPKAEPECRLPLVGTEVWQKGAIEIAPLLIVRDESHRLFLGGLRSRRARLRFTGCVHFAMKEICRSTDFQRTANSGLTGCLRRGVHRNLMSDSEDVARLLKARLGAEHSVVRSADNMHHSLEVLAHELRSFCDSANHREIQVSEDT